MSFPCNQFGGQEPGTGEEIKAFVKNLGVPMDDPSWLFMEKVDVNGPQTHEVYSYLKGATDDNSDLKWNFSSYWLVDRHGNVERHPGGRALPSSMAGRIFEALSEG